MLIDTEDFKHKLNNSKYYGTDVWSDICDMLAECKTINPDNRFNKIIKVLEKQILISSDDYEVGYNSGIDTAIRIIKTILTSE